MATVRCRDASARSIMTVKLLYSLHLKDENTLEVFFLKKRKLETVEACIDFYTRDLAPNLKQPWPRLDRLLLTPQSLTYATFRFRSGCLSIHGYQELLPGSDILYSSAAMADQASLESGEKKQEIHASATSSTRRTPETTKDAQSPCSFPKTSIR